MKRTFCKLLAAVLILALIPFEAAFPVSAAYPELNDMTNRRGYSAPEIQSPCAFVMEMNTGTILYSKNADEPHAPASTIKSLTALVAVESGNLDDLVTFSEASVTDIEEGGNNYDMRAGETMSLRSCLKIMMMASCNEAAYCIAEHLGGSLPGFAEMMNDRARELGAVNSNFRNPHGLTDYEQYTTARDLALIFAECVKNPVFMEVAAIESCCITDTSMSSYGYVYANHDKMMQPDSKYYRDYVRCGKTGFITQAGNTLVTYASRDGMDIVCAILYGESYDNVYTDTIALCDFAFDSFSVADTAELLREDIEAYIGESEISCELSRVLVPEWVSEEDITGDVRTFEKTQDAVFAGNAMFLVEGRSTFCQFTAKPLGSDIVFEIPVTVTDNPEPVEAVSQEKEYTQEPVSLQISWIIAAAGFVIAAVFAVLYFAARRKLKN